jgi:uncharacterized circularly permuted ATP-grasp superfamily protein
LFPNPEGDISLSPDDRIFVNGYKRGSKNHHTVFRRTDGDFGRSKGLNKDAFSGISGLILRRAGTAAVTQSWCRGLLRIIPGRHSWSAFYTPSDSQLNDSP